MVLIDPIDLTDEDGYAIRTSNRSEVRRKAVALACARHAGRLSRRQAIVIRRYYLSDDRPDLATIAAELSVTISGVCKSKRRAEKKLGITKAYDPSGVWLGPPGSQGRPRKAGGPTDLQETLEALEAHFGLSRGEVLRRLREIAVPDAAEAAKREGIAAG